MSSVSTKPHTSFLCTFLAWMMPFSLFPVLLSLSFSRNVFAGKDHTIHAKIHGVVRFNTVRRWGSWKRRHNMKRKYISVVPHGQPESVVDEYFEQLKKDHDAYMMKKSAAAKLDQRLPHLSKFREYAQKFQSAEIQLELEKKTHEELIASGQIPADTPFRPMTRLPEPPKPVPRNPDFSEISHQDVPEWALV